MERRDFKEQLKKTAHLARLHLTPEEEELFAKQLQNILDYFKKLQELDTSNVEPMAHVLPLYNIWREDEVRESISQKEALKNAPEIEDLGFKIPRIMKREE
ncbi:MAG: Asp-tRNA(Asn)/Glu-tRNA(Gln) amidotransferase subunit GatC [Dictyoglomus thermophilum]|nr:Asp-tRNA(Asn)/Glu-tRNA(Gln) amidotransferase subunit GatC [Dictyoglomus thermophilum]MCX7721035.1 Asp-tRNA(Asn)/Glu-tRNA(Gln) amidotransferase subunit GatC [Dictyoglomus thermophilum]